MNKAAAIVASFALALSCSSPPEPTTAPAAQPIPPTVVALTPGEARAEFQKAVGISSNDLDNRIACSWLVDSDSDLALLMAGSGGAEKAMSVLLYEDNFLNALRSRDELAKKGGEPLDPWRTDWCAKHSAQYAALGVPEKLLAQFRERVMQPEWALLKPGEVMHARGTMQLREKILFDANGSK